MRSVPAPPPPAPPSIPPNLNPSSSLFRTWIIFLAAAHSASAPSLPDLTFPEPYTLAPSPTPTQKGSCKTAPAHPWTQFHLNSNQALAGSFVSPLTSSPGNTRASLELCPVPARRSSAPVSPPPRLRLIPKPQLCPVSSYLYLGPTCVKKRCSGKLRSGRQGYEQVA